MGNIEQDSKIPDPLDFHDNPDPISSVPRDSYGGFLMLLFAVMVAVAIVAITVVEESPSHALQPTENVPAED